MDIQHNSSADPPPVPYVSVVAANSATTSFSAALQATKDFAIATFKAEIKDQQLYYHDFSHVNSVEKRAQLIFDTIVPFLPQPDHQTLQQQQTQQRYWERQRDLLKLGAIAHDMVQIFAPQDLPNTPRQRPSGQSEKATFERLLTFIQQINESTNANLGAASSFTGTPFTAEDIATLHQAIEATVCQYDAENNTIYQPLLYAQNGETEELSLVAHCLALADIGALGIEGIDTYIQEGGLLILEENLDIILFLRNPASYDADFREALRGRLLQRARFEVAFAKSRLDRLDRELAGLPAGAIAQLKQKVFKYLTPTTIQQLEAMTPTADDAPLSELLQYFKLAD